MNEKVKGLWEKVKEQLGKINKTVRTLFLATVGIILLVVVAFTVYNKTQYSVLFTNLGSEEANSIMSYLEDNGIQNYQFVGGDTIRVPSNQEARLKAQLLMEGYPKSGYSYETYRAAIGVMSTESDRNIAFLQDLQDRMAAVIRCLDGVQDAVVTIAEGDDNRYVLDQSNSTAASASVMVTMNSGTKLTNQQANAISNLVARGVKGLEIDNIAISDSQGNVYTPGDGSANVGEASTLKLQYEEQFNNNVRTEIMKVLGPLFGEDNVKVAVSSTVDISHSVSESTQYTVPEWAVIDGAGGRGIIGTQDYNMETIQDPNQTTGGAVGTESNADVPNYPELSPSYNGDEPYWGTQGSIDYDNDVVKEQVERTSPVLVDMMIAVTINSKASSSVNVNNLVGHVARAAGIKSEYQDEMVSIFVGPFFTDEGDGGDDGEPDLFPSWMLYAAIGGVALLLLLLIVIGILRKGKKKKKQNELRSMLNQQISMVEEATSSGADIMELRTEKSMELRQDIREFAEENPEIAAFMLKNWLRGGDPQNG